MKLFCFCRELDNYYLKDLKFNKGTYLINLKNKQKIIFGSKIKTPKSIQNILLKKAYVIKQNASNIEDVYFKNIKFRLIDFSDTTAVKLKPVSKEKFWNNNFLPKTN